MEYRLLKATYFDLTERIDEYYDNKLMQEPRARANLEYFKEELTQDLAVEIYANYNRDTYSGYDPEKFIWLKAKKVWITFARRLKRESSRGSTIEIDLLTNSNKTDDFLRHIENRDTVSLIEKLIPSEDFRLLFNRGLDLSYEEIFKLGGRRSPDAAKMEFYRWKAYLRRRISGR